MPRKSFTLRIDTGERVALKHLSEVEGRPVNQLVIEAIKSYLNREGQKERGLDATLKALRKYRKQNAGFQRAIREFVDAEATHDDPLEGEPLEGQLVGGRFKSAGPAQNKIRKLIDA